MIYNHIMVFFITLLVLSLLRRAAPRLGLMDTPGAHHYHDRPTPMVGGLAIFTAFFFGVLLADVPLNSFRPLFLGCGILVLVGVLDDVHQLSSLARFAAQIVAALVMAWFGDVILLDLGNLVGAGVVELGDLAVPITVFATVGVINAMNMSDGMDGLAGGLFLVAFGALAWVSLGSGVATDTAMLTLVIISITCFLLFNARFGLRSRASVFLGDAGSMFLGFMLSWFLIQFSQQPVRLIDPVTALWLMAVPLVDTVTVMIRRMVFGRSPFKADRTHLHHLLQHAGLGVDQSLAVILATAVAAVAAGLTMEYLQWSEPLRFALFMTWFALHAALTHRYIVRHGLAGSQEPPRSTS